MPKPVSLRGAAAFLLALVAGGVVTAARADEAAIRKNLAERLPSLPKIDEVSKTPIPGLYELRLGSDIVYTDENGNHLIQGALIDTKTRADLTQARIDKLTAIDFASLPLKNAMLIKQGTGARKVVVFADPNCGYCKRLEKDLLALKDVSIYTFLYPILGPDSHVKSKDIWCAKDPAKAWQDWMVRDQAIPALPASCDTTAMARNVDLGRAHKITGTPTLVFIDGNRVPGAIDSKQVEKLLTDSTKS